MADGWRSGSYRAGAAVRTGRAEGHAALPRAAPRKEGGKLRTKDKAGGGGGEPSREHPGHSLPLQSGTRAAAAADHGEAWPGEGPGAAGPGAARRRPGPWESGAWAGARRLRREGAGQRRDVWAWLFLPRPRGRPRQRVVARLRRAPRLPRPAPGGPGSLRAEFTEEAWAPPGSARSGARPEGCLPGSRRAGAGVPCAGLGG